MTQLRIKELLGRANLILDKGIHFLPGFVMVKSSEMEAILDRIDASIPEDIKDAENILRKREEIQIAAKQEAEKIIAEAENKADKLISESELLNQVQREAERIKEQVLAECQQLRDNTIEEAKKIKMQAEDEARTIKEGVLNYVEQVLSEIEGDLNKQQTIVKNGQLYLEKLKSSAANAQLQGTQEDYTAANYPM